MVKWRLFREFSLINIPWGSGVFWWFNSLGSGLLPQRFGPDPWLEHQGNKPHIIEKKREETNRKKYIYQTNKKKNGKTKPHDKW